MNRIPFEPEAYGNLDCMSFNNREECDAFSEYLDSIGKRWRSGERYTERSYFSAYEDVVYYFNSGSYGSMERATEAGLTILNYDWFCYGDDDERSDEPKVTLTFDQLWN